MWNSSRSTVQWSPTRSPKKSSPKKSPKKIQKSSPRIQPSSLGYVIDDKDVDESLRQKMSTEGYDKLNVMINDKVIKSYQKSMSAYSQFMLDNARIIGRIDDAQGSPKSARSKFDDSDYLNGDEGNWRLDPETLDDNELFEETMQLQKTLEKQQEKNEEARNEIQILSLAVRRIDLEKQGLYLKLRRKETLSPP
ncbi:hypothetical protein TRFO_29457 [Tritrichomonas foetus]|uniref:Uncharacterized protein n=1 Tax=Tritrichomonas foetus TaxID=1144522 RepID=A0A1J4JVR0_9EUKA|nr:hypothetical protein TRFO_29457 [Tritrichomonas foetus]|eukprot:OHT03215.1 hypothetical protein TRFO_29457 [Tritrichomonas foetus]